MISTAARLLMAVAVIGSVLWIPAAGARDCHKMISAFTLEDVIYLVTDRTVFHFDFDGYQKANGLDIPVHISGQTAAISFSHRAYVLLSCEENQAFDTYGRENPFMDFLPEGPVDAAFNWHNQIYLFSGNTYRVYNMRTRETDDEKTNSDMGLPEKLDAAWATKDLIFAVRGSNFYVAEFGKTRRGLYFKGPIPLDQFLYFDDPDIKFCSV